MTMRNIRSIRTHIFMIIFSVVMIYPVLWWLGAAFKSNSEMSLPGILPKTWMWSNFTEGWVSMPKYSFAHFYMNSFELTLTIVALAVVACSLTAFGFARLDFPLKNFWFTILILTLMLPAQVTIVPQYIMFNDLNWINTYLPFWVPHALVAGNGSAFFVYLMVQFIRGIPKELDESAKIDGCNWFGIYRRIIIPLLKPAIVSVIIFSFLWNWDDFLGHLLYINSLEDYTVGLALKSFADGESATPWGQLLAMSLISVMPAFAIFITCQKQLVDGIASGAVKG